MFDIIVTLSELNLLHACKIGNLEIYNKIIYDNPKCSAKELVLCTS
jgi:hypothetical protein